MTTLLVDSLDLAVDDPAAIWLHQAEQEFAKLQQYRQNGLYKQAMSRENRLKNRYRNIVPVSSTRVRLSDNIKKYGIGTDYINANFLQQHGDTIICTQAPVPNSIDAFWVMIWTYKVPIITMLCKLVENGYVKSHAYWPQNPGETLTFANGQITVCCVKMQDLPQHQIRVTHLKINDRPLIHLWYRGWNDFGCPSSSKDIELLRAIEAIYHRDNQGPNVIHCSAGVGRSGTYALIKAGIDNASTPVTELLLKLRKQRTGLVQHVNQYKFAKAYIQSHRH